MFLTMHCQGWRAWLSHPPITTLANCEICRPAILSSYVTAAVNLILTSCLLASRPSRLTKQLICNRKSIKIAKPANMEKVLTAGMLDRAPKEEQVEIIISWWPMSLCGYCGNPLHRNIILYHSTAVIDSYWLCVHKCEWGKWMKQAYPRKRPRSQRRRRGAGSGLHLQGYGQSAGEAPPGASARPSVRNWKQK